MTRPTLYTQIAFTTDLGEEPAWTDVSAYVKSISTKCGRSDELSPDEASTATIVFNNPAAIFDPENTASPYYPNILPMKRIRVAASNTQAVQGLTLDGSIKSYAWTRERAELHISGDIDIRVKCALTDWTPSAACALVARYSDDEASAHARQGYVFGVNTDGTLYITFSNGIGSESSVDSTSATGITNGTVKWVRVTVDVSNPDVGGSGFAGSEVKFYTSTDGSSWTQLGTTTGSIPGNSIGNSHSKTVIGAIISCDDIESIDFHTIGIISRVEIRDGIGGTVVAAPHFDSLFQEASFTDDYGVLWHFSGATDLYSAKQYLFSGFVTSYDQVRPTPRSLECHVSCVDGFALLNLNEIDIPSAPSEPTDVRVNRVLDQVGWPVSERAIYLGELDCVAMDIDQIPALEHLQHIAFTEGGRFFLDRDGTSTFLSRATAYYPPYADVTYTFSATSSTTGYINFELEYSIDRVYNRIRVSTYRNQEDYEQAEDLTSQAKYGVRVLTRSNLLTTSALEASSIADGILEKYRDPKVRVRAITVDPEGALTDIWPDILALKLNYKVTVERPILGSSSSIARDERIQSISHSISPKSWTIKFELSEIAENSEPAIYWRLDSAAFGILDSTAILG